MKKFLISILTAVCLAGCAKDNPHVTPDDVMRIVEVKKQEAFVEQMTFNLYRDELFKKYNTFILMLRLDRTKVDGKFCPPSSKNCFKGVIVVSKNGKVAGFPISVFFIKGGWGASFTKDFMKFVEHGSEKL